ncbi:probable MNI1 Putative S-adenosylmethionine-dependent methyltransferase of the seven beta-strand family [Rhynchosporium agropyri]|uniref:protein-histidine N-methyltransferase n=1 Tax=Rhynchosporium agropyri TaxID=914238 RepID=A0A1E1JUF7_9HELO|nr:probable MNI1 Putative S-adenosylmethionine-dependent methyltransferase of the seven beta-strand family [Rhynchosporium agropyri]
MSTFSFSFAGDDIEDATVTKPDLAPVMPSHAAETGTLQRATSSAFPIVGQPLLQPQVHDLETMLKALPSKIVYNTLVIKLDDGSQISVPRRELWDVRVQLMAEEDDEGLGNLGKDDVKTGVYEGGFKSWESSVDVVKVLHKRKARAGLSGKVLELGCGTALPSLAVFQWLLECSDSTGALDLGFADYNPTVLQLVTLPNILLSWAQTVRKDSWEAEGELDLDVDFIEDFLASLESHQIRLSFFSGAWSPGFVELVKGSMRSDTTGLTIIGAETIYSPAALHAFAETLMSLLEGVPANESTSLVAAKKVYFGVGGSMVDFCEMVRSQGGSVKQIREESDGVRRAVVEVKMPSL